nr:MAG TPA: hypothetical protein [Caudoviricetes sp.]
MNNISIRLESLPVNAKILKNLEPKFIVIDDGKKELRFPLKEDIDMKDILSAMCEFAKEGNYPYSISANVKVEND